ncbi:MAG TPA: hypothetical protein VMH00_13825 [Candidatus Limnocylindrales bacterium]|nr:hypothetical protein [Candidatus Limnocylindrales bacterium]
MNSSAPSPKNRRARWLLAIIAFVGLLALAACGPAFPIHPLYMDGDVVFDADLLAAWGGTDEEPNIFQIEKASDNSYRITVRSSDSSKEVFFSAHLVNLSGYLFLDATQENARGQGGDEDSLQIPAHIIARIWLNRDSLQLSYLDEDGVASDDSVGPTRVPDFGTVLTGSTEALQHFAIEHADDNMVFSQVPDEMRRQN